MPDIRASDVALLVAPLVIGLGTARLFAPTGYRVCGKRPSLQPPGWVFGVAWTILYALVGVAAVLAWRRSGRRWTRGLVALALAFGLLVAWWLTFSNICAPVMAFIAIVASALAVVAATWQLHADGDRTSAALLLPLVAWMSFASVLSFQASASTVRPQ